MLKMAHTAAALLVLSASLNASIIKIPPVTQEELTYDKLPCSDAQKGYIAELIATMGTESWIDLFKHRKHLESIGGQITYVHPLKFLGTIFSNPSLKPHMIAIFNDFLKRGQILDGLIPNLNREADKGTLSKYLAPFAAEVHVAPEALQGHFQSRDWEGMVRFLNQS